MKKTKATWGGARKGAGQKGFGGTTVVRVPDPVLSAVKKIVADFKSSAKKKRADNRQPPGDL